MISCKFLLCDKMFDYILVVRRNDDLSNNYSYFM